MTNLSCCCCYFDTFWIIQSLHSSKLNKKYILEVITVVIRRKKYIYIYIYICIYATQMNIQAKGITLQSTLVSWNAIKLRPYSSSKSSKNFSRNDICDVSRCCHSIGSKIRSKCVFCFHCIKVSSSSIYPFASNKPITLNNEREIIRLCYGPKSANINKDKKNNSNATTKWK